MLLHNKTETEKIIDMIEQSAKSGMSSLEIIQTEVDEWKSSRKRQLMMVGERYYLNHTDIQDKKRTLANGVELKHRTNTKLEHAFLRKLVDQKIGYLLSNLPSVTVEKKLFQEELDKLFDRAFWRLIKGVGREAINKGIAWLQVYFKDSSTIAFKMIPSEQVIPLWTDNAHTELNELIRVYDVETYSGRVKETITKVEHWTLNGVAFYVMNGNELIEDVSMMETDANGAFVMDKHGSAIPINYHLKLNDEPYNWERIPFIPFRYNDLEQPLVDILKGLVDDYNMQASTNADLLADLPKFIYKLVGYGGQNLEEFINDLQQFMAIKLNTGGDVDKLQADPNTDAIEKTLMQRRKDIYEYGRGVSFDGLQSSGNTTNLKIKSLFSELDMDCNIIENEFQYSFEILLWFITTYLNISGKGDFEKENVNVTFNRDILINESDVIADCKNSVGIIPDVQIRANHPWFNSETENLWEKQEILEDDTYALTLNNNKTNNDSTNTE